MQNRQRAQQLHLSSQVIPGTQITLLIAIAGLGQTHKPQRGTDKHVYRTSYTIKIASQEWNEPQSGLRHTRSGQDQRCALISVVASPNSLKRNQSGPPPAHKLSFHSSPKRLIDSKVVLPPRSHIILPALAVPDCCEIPSRREEQQPRWMMQ